VLANAAAASSTERAHRVRSAANDVARRARRDADICEPRGCPMFPTPRLAVVIVTALLGGR
jgi:hypothetical protein